MTASAHTTERARAELAALFPLRDEIAFRAGALRAEQASAPQSRRERLDARALRFERLVRLLDTRIRLAAEVLARGGVSARPPAALCDPDAS
jgi:putative hemolysin